MTPSETVSRAQPSQAWSHFSPLTPTLAGGLRVATLNWHSMTVQRPRDGHSHGEAAASSTGTPPPGRRRSESA
eukprot:1799700-Rhodomonas_salina.1